MKDKRITNTAAALITLWNVGWFTFIWLTFYNAGGRLDRTIIYVAVYFAVYRWFCNLYNAFAIASSSLTDTVLSHLIGFGLTDLLLYVIKCISRNTFLPLMPGIGTVFMQLVGTSLLVFLAKQYLMRHVPPSRTLLVYGNEVKETEIERFKKHLLYKYKHIFDICTECLETDAEGTLDSILDEYEKVIFYGIEQGLWEKFVRICIEHRIVFYYIPGYLDILTRGTKPKHLLDTPMMQFDYSYAKRINSFSKRLADIVFSLLVLIILSPFMLITALAIKLEDHGPVFYKQKRVTKDGQVFDIIKFRSMRTDAEKMGVIPAIDHDPRITKTGRIIRKLRIDESPQLLNVLKGDMSFVGPRPERIEHVQMYEKAVPEFKYRLRVKAGLTGYAQVYGKYNTSPEDKLKLDLLYIENQNLIEDMKIILLTIRTVFQPESTEGFEDEVSMEINRTVSQYSSQEEQS